MLTPPDAADIHADCCRCCAIAAMLMSCCPPPLIHAMFYTLPDDAAALSLSSRHCQLISLCCRFRLALSPPRHTPAATLYDALLLIR